MNDINTWGPLLWLELHNRSFNYPENPTVRQSLEEAHFFRTLDQKIPCKVCRGHYRSYLSKHPVQYHVDSRENISNWVVNLHNEINIRTNKDIVSFDEAKEMYMTSDNNNIYYMCIITLIICMIIVLIKALRY